MKAFSIIWILTTLVGTTSALSNGFTATSPAYSKGFNATTPAYLKGFNSTAPAHSKGFNVGSYNPNGSCKNASDWVTTFMQLQSLPGKFTSARLYSSSDCNTLANAVPAALNSSQTILVGIWTTDNAHYAAEKAALLAAIQHYGDSWMLGIAVGSEDLFRGKSNASHLAQQLNEVRGIVRAQGSQVAVGHVDDWTAWANPANAAVVNASDFVGADIYPYWDAVSATSANASFWSSLTSVRKAVAAVKNTTAIWITETGWAVSGASVGSATASSANAAKYWKDVACSAFNVTNTFWVAHQDYTISPSFGAVSELGEVEYVSAC